MEFYENEHQRKQKAEARQIRVGSCYQDAVEKIDNIHRKNEEYAEEARKQLHKSLNRNSHRTEIIGSKVRALSALTKRRVSVG